MCAGCRCRASGPTPATRDPCRPSLGLSSIGAQPNAPLTASRWTPLHTACKEEGKIGVATACTASSAAAAWACWCPPLLPACLSLVCCTHARTHACAHARAHAIMCSTVAVPPQAHSCHGPAAAVPCLLRIQVAVEIGGRQEPACRVPNDRPDGARTWHDCLRRRDAADESRVTWPGVRRCTQRQT